MMDLTFDDAFAPARVAVLLKEFSRLDDEREPWRIMYPLAEMLLVLTCATVAAPWRSQVRPSFALVLNI